MKELKKALLEKAKMYLGDTEYKAIEKFIAAKAWTNLRVFLGDLSEQEEIAHMATQGRLNEWLAIDEMNNIAIELAIQKNDGVDDEMEPKRKRSRPRLKAVLQ